MQKEPGEATRIKNEKENSLKNVIEAMSAEKERSPPRGTNY